MGEIQLIEKIIMFNAENCFKKLLSLPNILLDEKSSTLLIAMVLNKAPFITATLQAMVNFQNDLPQPYYKCQEHFQIASKRDILEVVQIVLSYKWYSPTNEEVENSEGTIVRDYLYHRFKQKKYGCE